MQFPFRQQRPIHSQVVQAELVFAEEFAAAPLDTTNRRIVTGFAVDSDNTAVRDDAIFVRKLDDGYEVIVSVADVGAVVPHRSFIDRIARMRGETRSNGERVTPMLHQSLSLSKLSLTEGRPTLSAIITLDSKFATTDVSFEQTVLHKPQIANFKKIGERASSGLTNYWFTAKNLRRARGMEPLQKASPYAKGQVIVHEFMNLANAALTQYAEMNKVPLLYRNLVDDQPSYSANAWGHEQAASYAQFTSPIRRFADLVNTRQLSAHIRGVELPYERGELDLIGSELTAMQAPGYQRPAYPNAIKQAAEMITHITQVDEETVLREIRESLKSPNPHQNAILHAMFPDPDHGVSSRFGRLALQHMFNKPHLAAATLSSARQSGHAGEPTFVSLPSDDGYHEAVTVEISGREQRGEAVAPNRKLARQLAVTSVFAQHFAETLNLHASLGNGLGI